MADAPATIICQICNCATRCLSDYRTHMLLLHMKRQPFLCSYCGARFFVGADLKDHSSNVFKCRVLEKLYGPPNPSTTEPSQSVEVITVEDQPQEPQQALPQPGCSCSCASKPQASIPKQVISGAGPQPGPSGAPQPQAGIWEVSELGGSSQHVLKPDLDSSYDDSDVPACEGDSDLFQCPTCATIFEDAAQLVIHSESHIL